MAQEKESPEQSPKSSTSKLAVAAFVLGLLSLVACILWPIPALPAIICGIIALIRIHKSHGQLKGTWLAIIGLIFTAIAFWLLFVFMSSQGRISSWMICGVKQQMLGRAISVYAQDNSGRLPAAGQWCDLLIMKCDVDIKSLICPDSDAVEGESSYAMNIYAAGKKLDELPADMVLLFETDAGKEAGPRNTSVSIRTFYSFMEKCNSEWIAQNKSNKVHLMRWNQAGGVEILAVRDHKGWGKKSGCNVTFAGGHNEFISGDELQKLRWTIDKKEPNMPILNNRVN